MFTTSPPRVVLTIQAAVLCVFGLQWIAFGNGHSSQFPFTQLRTIGAHIDPGRPMLLWGLLFLVAGLAEFVGIVLASPRLAGLGALLAAPVAFFYGVLNGWASAQHVVLIDGNRVHDGTDSILILMIGLALWAATSAVMLLGRKDSWRYP